MLPCGLRKFLKSFRLIKLFENPLENVKNALSSRLKSGYCTKLLPNNTAATATSNCTVANAMKENQNGREVVLIKGDST